MPREAASPAQRWRAPYGAMQDEKTSHIPEEWLVPSVAAEESMADSLGSYRLCFEVAAGGMATVYLALYEGALGFEKVVALKKIHKHLARERQFVDMFFDEARIAAHIDHPFVCKVVDFGNAQDSYYLAMEYLVGEPLSAIWETLEKKPELAASPHLPRVMARVVAGLCEGLHAAHELTDEGENVGLVHRDVTPANLFTLYDGTVRVVDFGIAKAKNRISHTETGHVKGKYAYVSPEQLKMKPLDRRCDVWGMGVVLWEMLTGRRLFKRESPVDTISAVTTVKVPPPSSIRPDIPPALDEIVLKALSRIPAGRHRTAREMALELESWLATTGHTVPHAEVAEFLESLFPGAHARKRQLMELTRRGESAVPIADREEPWSPNPSMEAPTNVFQPERMQARRSRPRGRALSEPTADVDLDEVELVPNRRATDGQGARRQVGEPAVPASKAAHDRGRAARDEDRDDDRDEDESRAETADDGADDLAGEPSSAPKEGGRRPDRKPERATLRVDSGEGRPTDAKRRPRSRIPMALAAAAVIGIGAAVAALVGPERAVRGGAVGEARSAAAPPATIDPGERPASETRSADDLASLAQQVEGTETWPPWAGEGDEGAGGTGEVYLTTRGGWADVYLDGRKVGRTPQELRLPAGNHRVVLRPYGDGAERPMAVDVRAGRRVYLDVAIPPRAQ